MEYRQEDAGCRSFLKGWYVIFILFSIKRFLNRAAYQEIVYIRCINKNDHDLVNSYTITSIFLIEC